MSMSSVVVKGLIIAQKNLGDLVQDATVLRPQGRIYDPDLGEYVSSDLVIPVKYVPDKLSFTEQLSEDFTQEDFKILVFNPDNNISIYTSDAIQIRSTVYQVRKYDPVYVGPFKAMIGVVLRK